MLKNIMYIIRFPSRLKYWFYYQSYSFAEKLPFYILGNIRKYFFGFLVLFKLILKHNLFFRKIKTNKDYRKIDFTALNYLRDFDLYLRPSYCYYPFCAKIIITKKCSFNCDYCYQKRKQIKEINLDEFKKILIHLRKLRIKYISLLGGEIFLNFSKLIRFISISKRFGFEIRGLTTNGFWCVNEKKVITYLTALKKAGYNGMIPLSIGREHQRQISLSNFVNLYNISRRIFGKNIFNILVEANTYEEYISIKKEAKKVLGKGYNFLFIGLIDTKSKIKKKKPGKDIFWTYCEANNLSINKNYMFCQAACSLNKEYKLNLKKDFNLTDYLKIENKLLDLVNQVSFERIKNYIKSNHLFDEINKFYFPCELCIFLSKHPKILEKIHNKFIN